MDIRITKEFATEQDKKWYLEQGKLFLEKDGWPVKLWYYTFKQDDFRCNIHRLVLLSERYTNYFLMTAPVGDWDDALKWVREQNDHLNIISIGEPGYNGDDFPNNRRTAKVYFTLKELA